MLPKASSGTTSSKSNTGELTPIQFVKGVGPKLGLIFKSRDIATVRELLYFFPRAYEDRSQLLTIAQLQEGVIATLPVRVQSVRGIPTRAGKRMLEVRVMDETGTMVLKWFHSPKGMESRFFPGKQVIVTGTVKKYMGRSEIVHPEITWNMSADASEGDQAKDSPGEPHVGRVVPIYTEIEGVSSRVLRNVLWEAVQGYTATVSEDLPERYLKKHDLPKLSEAIQRIHFPPEAADVQSLVDFNTPYHWRLIYEEFFKFEYLVLRQRMKMEMALAQDFGNSGGKDALLSLEKLLPFQLTVAQQMTIDEILKDIGQPHPMNRLVQGDVGSGKTVVAFLTAACVLAEGGQVALMAPTEILAEQHYRNAVKLFGGRLNVAMITGKSTTSERNKIIQKIGSGEPIVLIGTHALLEDPIEFKNLAYTIIDEQHRFGVDQRRTLRSKGTRKNEKGKTLHPHTLIMTATPIPRTLALTAYGDLAVSSIKELPPGRSPIVTRVVHGENHEKAHDFIKKQLQKGHQAYFIYPLVNESEAEGFTALKSAVMEADTLAHQIYPEFKVGLLHGQQKPDEKAKVMEKFKSGETHILVSTTVVEVGVDVPNATVMAIEHAERFGLSQLHQLRGRVGRGSAQSYCFLFAAKRVGETTAQRLEVLEETNDGFKIAEADLEIRGPGEFLGTRQSGGLPFRLANLVRDREWLIRARDDADQLLQEDPELLRPEHLPLRRYYEREGIIQFERLKTS